MKTFYKTRPVKKIFFSTDVKIRSYAYGKDVLDEFKTWRKQYIDRWNAPKKNFWMMETGSIDGNYAKIDRVGELRVVEPSRNQQCIVKKSGELSPLWFDDRYLEVNKYGDIILNGKETDINLGPELKAWGISPLLDRYNLSCMLIIFRNNEHGLGELKAYSMDLSNGLKIDLKCSVTLEATLSRKSTLQCFGRHIFLVSESQLHYYYYNTDLSRFEEVAIDRDIPNSETDCCQNIIGSLVCDAGGHVFWRSGNCVYFIQIGFPKRVGCIDLGESNAVKNIQTFRDDLYIYCKSRITSEYTCLRFNAGAEGSRSPVMFNKGSRYNLIYAEKNGLLHYVKIPYASRVAFSARMNAGVERIISEIDISGVKQMFCVDGDIYLNCSYVGNAKKD